MALQICPFPLLLQTCLTHLITHSGEIPHKCAMCKKPFSQSGAPNIHLRLHHPDQLKKGPQMLKRLLIFEEPEKSFRDSTSRPEVPAAYKGKITLLAKSGPFLDHFINIQMSQRPKGRKSWPRVRIWDFLALFGHLWPSGHQTTCNKYGQVGYLLKELWNVAQQC